MLGPTLVQRRLHLLSSFSLGPGSDLNGGMRKLDKSTQDRSICLGFMPDKLKEKAGKVIKHLYCVC